MATSAKRALRTPRLAYAAEPCDKEIDQARLTRLACRATIGGAIRAIVAAGRPAGEMRDDRQPHIAATVIAGGFMEGPPASRQQHEDTDDCQHTTWPRWLIESPGWLAPAWRAIHRGHASKTFTKDAHEQAPDP
ncbi:hypothetical protein D5045_25550 [Verminephrobacter eiseniae]|uniref:hypothetical protein n=1 Tax=Verminephrobacter eiseniae TaxID=364317 RepID=UPI0022386BC4|nr:hypothetical protein [Verminephrobacter eiseniae]MCW5263364.1 hypothetical protein [Verminephrobacter eiseniae]